MAELVLTSADALPRFVVCDDDLVAHWATDQGATVVWRPGVGLNGAVASAVSHLADCGVERVLVAHSDLPLSRGLDRLVELPSDIVLVPDRRGDGTNVVVVPAALGFTFGYGSASFPRHRAHALALNQTITIVHDHRLAHDVDTIDDLVPIQELFPWLPTNPANPR